MVAFKSVWIQIIVLQELNILVISNSTKKRIFQKKKKKMTIIGCENDSFVLTLISLYWYHKRLALLCALCCHWNRSKLIWPTHLSMTIKSNCGFIIVAVVTAKQCSMCTEKGCRNRTMIKFCASVLCHMNENNMQCYFFTFLKNVSCIYSILKI